MQYIYQSKYYYQDNKKENVVFEMILYFRIEVFSKKILKRKESCNRIRIF